MRYLDDSDWLTDAAGGGPRAVRTLNALSDTGIGVRIVAIGEVYEGAFGFPEPEAVLASFREFLAYYTLVPLSDPIVEVFARTRARLRKAGQLIPDMDLLIAATAVYHDLTLLTRNRQHFERIPELKLYRSS